MGSRHIYRRLDFFISRSDAMHSCYVGGGKGIITGFYLTIELQARVFYER